MLALHDPLWSELEDALGPATESAELLGRLSTVPPDDVEYANWDEIWGRLCRQDAIYTASFAAVPWIVRLAQARPPAGRTMYLAFVGRVETLRRLLGTPLPKVVEESYVEALTLARDLTLATLRNPFDVENFHRWIAMGALTPFMQLHGRANLTPWTVPGETKEETVPVYRFWAKLHTAMIPFFASETERAWANKKSVVVPVDPNPASWAGDFRYQLGTTLFVAPMVAPGDKRDVKLPSDAAWVDFWTGTEHAAGATLTGYDAADHKRIPLFLRAGAILPLDVVDAENGLGTTASKDALTVLVVPAASSSFELIDADGSKSTFGATKGATTNVTATALKKTTIFRVQATAGATSVKKNAASLDVKATRGDFDAATEAYFVEAPYVWVKVAAASTPTTIEIQ